MGEVVYKWEEKVYEKSLYHSLCFAMNLKLLFKKST